MNVLVLGANSFIAQNVARLFAIEKSVLYLIGRNPEKLENFATDLRVQYAAQIYTEATDLNLTDQHPALLERAWAALKTVDYVIIAHGVLGDQKRDQDDYRNQYKIFQSNFLSQASLLTEISKKMISQNAGTIGVITSVAGDRGRRTNYVYGSAKGALSIYLSGLRSRLTLHNVTVCEHKLGFVDTPMTSEFKKGVLWAKADHVAKQIKRQLIKKVDVNYIPFFWYWIMLVIRLLPERLFKKSSF